MSYWEGEEMSVEEFKERLDGVAEEEVDYEL